MTYHKVQLRSSISCYNFSMSDICIDAKENTFDMLFNFCTTLLYCLNIVIAIRLIKSYVYLIFYILIKILPHAKSSTNATQMCFISKGLLAICRNKFYLIFSRHERAEILLQIRLSTNKSNNQSINQPISQYKLIYHCTVLF
jgi:hypothetical protein